MIYDIEEFRDLIDIKPLLHYFQVRTENHIMEYDHDNDPEEASLLIKQGTEENAGTALVKTSCEQRSIRNRKFKQELIEAWEIDQRNPPVNFRKNATSIPNTSKIKIGDACEGLPKKIMKLDNFSDSSSRKVSNVKVHNSSTTKGKILLDNENRNFMAKDVLRGSKRLQSSCSNENLTIEVKNDWASVSVDDGEVIILFPVTTHPELITFHGADGSDSVECVVKQVRNYDSESLRLNDVDYTGSIQVDQHSIETKNGLLEFNSSKQLGTSKDLTPFRSEQILFERNNRNFCVQCYNKAIQFQL